MKRAFLLLVLLFLAAFTLEAQTCVQGRPSEALFPFFGNSNPDPSMSTPNVTIYTNDAGRQSSTLQTAANAGATTWNSGCPRSGGGGSGGSGRSYRSVPNFNVNWSQNRPGSGAEAERAGLLLNFIDAPAPITVHSDGTADIHPATWRGAGNEIEVYRKCPHRYKFPEYGCQGDARTLINWGSDMGQTAISHEIGHALGLDHDREQDAQGNQCGMSVMNAKPTPGAGVTSGHCDVANRVNDDAARCNTETAGPGETNPCEVAGRRSGGNDNPGAGGHGDEFCNDFPDLCDGGPTSWAGGAPVCNWFCVGVLGEWSCDWGCYAPAVARIRTTSEEEAELDHAAPLVGWAQPAENATLSGIVTISGYAHEFFHMPNLTFYIDGASIPVTNVQAGLSQPNVITHSERNQNSGFSAKLDTRRVSNGTHTLSMLAMDIYGFPTRIDRQITTNNTCTDINAPTVSVDVPATVTGTVTVTANTTDDVGVTEVEFRIGGVKKSVDTTAPFTYTWDSTGYAAGDYTVQAIAADACGNKTTDQKTVTVPVQADAARIVTLGTIPHDLKTGQSVNVSVTVRNIGSSTWTAAGMVRLGAVNPENNTTWGTSRVYLAAGDSIAQNAEKTFTWTITAPAAAGTYPFQWRMVRDNNQWFGDATPVQYIKVTRPPGPPVARNDRAKTKRDTAVTINVLENDRDPNGQPIGLTASPITAQPLHGTAVRVSNTSIRYTPNTTFAGNDVFEYEIADSAGNLDRAWVAVHVGRTKNLPVAVDDNATTNANQSKTISVLNNDYSPDGDPIALTASPVIYMPGHGSVTRVSDTSLSYMPDHDFTGTDSFAYEISDSEFGTAAAIVTVTVTEGNRAPVAVDDSAVTGVGAAVTIDVVANDTDPDGDPLTLIPNPIVVAPQHGTAQRVSPTAIVYTPAPGYSGTDTFQYEIGDGNGGRARGTVTITISNTNRPPNAEDDTAVTTAGVAVTINVTANDSDVDGDRVGLITSPIIVAPTNGTAVKISASSITYTPRSGYTGPDRFQYEIGDYSSGRSRAWVDITVGAGTPNRNPVAVDDDATTKVNTSIDIAVTSNDSDPDGDTVSLITNPIIVAPAHGTATKLNSTTIRYVPATDYVGADTLQYEIGDGNGKRARAWLRITVRDANSRPVAVDDNGFTWPGQAVTVQVTANDYDSDGDPIVVLSSAPITVAPTYGTATKVSASGIQYTPNAGFAGTDRFQYQIGDGRGGRDRAWVNVTVSSSSIVPLSETTVPTIADNDQAESASETAVPVVVLANDYTVDGRRVMLASSPVITAPLYGTVERTSDTTLSYIPSSGFRGNDRFEYEVVDTMGTTTRAWVVVQIPGENHPPIAVSDDVIGAMDNALEIEPLANDSDPDGDPLVLSIRAITAPPLLGTVRRSDDHFLIYTPLHGVSGDDTFTYEISDGRGGTAEASVVVHIVGTQPPVAQNDSATVNSGVPATINVLANDSDPNGDRLRVTASQAPQNGSVVWNDDGTATYVSHPGFAGTETFTYTISDPAGLTSTATVTITVVIPNRPPVVNNDSAETKTRTAVLIGVLANDWDYDYPTTLRLQSVTTPANGTVFINIGSQSVTYTPGNTFAGTDTFNYTVTDGTNAVTGTVTVTVLNQAPIPHSEILAAPEDTWVGYQAYHVLGNDNDPDGDELHIVSVEQPQHGTFMISPDSQQFSYKSNENWNGIDSFYYTVGDPFGATVRVLAQIGVSAVNDSPVAVNDAFSVYKNQLLTITEAQVVGNDTDVEGHTISIYSVGAATNGTTRLLENGSIEYQPYGEFVGTDSFEYIVDDSGGGAYGFGRINITVQQDTPPVANFTFSCTNLLCSFDASSSTDDRGIVTYQWLLGNGSAASGKTFSYSYATTGVYSVRLTVQDAIGQTVATVKAVTVTCPLPTISAQPTSRAITSGQTTTFSVTASGASSYQWFEGTSGTTTTPVGTNSSSFTTPALTTTKSYWVRVSNSCGNTASATATVTVCAPPAIATQPASQTIASNTTATLSVVASGSGPFSYQWYEGTSGTTTTPVGFNSSSFQTPALTATKSYWVRVTSACNGGVASSATAMVTVSQAVLARRQFAANVANSQTSITTNWSQPTQAGTLLVAVISTSSDFYPIANWTIPAGWQLAVSYEWTHIKTAIYYYPNNPGGRTSETIGTGGSFMWRDMVLQLAEYTGVATVSPLDKTAFNGNSASDGYVDTGYTAQTTQPKELIITALTSQSVTDFYGASQGFTEISDRNIGWNLTTAMHEKIVTTTGSYGHYAQTSSTSEWLGLVATFKPAN